MEVSTMSPAPTSPTEGPDSCGIDVTNLAIDTVTLLICLCGLAGNGAVLWLLGFLICRNPITVYILNLASANFLFLLFVVPSTLLYLLEDVSCSTVMSPKHLRLFFLLSLFPYNTGLYLLTAISIERCISILFPFWYRCHHSQCQSRVVCVLLWALSVIFVMTVISLCQSQGHEHCQLSLISMHSLNLFLLAPSVLISRTILLIKVLSGSQQQQSEKHHVVISFTVLLMLLFTLPLSLWNFLQQFSYSVVSSQIIFLLTCIHSSIKPFMYFWVGSRRRHSSQGSCWRNCSMESLRESLQRVFEEPEENRDGADIDMGARAC